MPQSLTLSLRGTDVSIFRQFRKWLRIQGCFDHNVRIAVNQSLRHLTSASAVPPASVSSAQSLTSPKRRLTTIYTPPHVKCLQQRAFSDKRNYEQRKGALNVDGEEVKSENLPVCFLPYIGLPSHPDVMELQPGQRLVAIGDVHGDFDQLLYALSIAGVVAEENVNEEDEGRSFVWVGGNSILVQIGDVLDRGPHELQCWQLLADLARQAHEQGGAVVFLYGNHELWTSVGFYQLDHDRYMQNLDYDDGIDDEFEVEFGDHFDDSFCEAEEDWRYARTLHHIVTNGIQLHPRKVAARWAALEPGGVLAKHFLSNFKIAVKVGQTILVHAGIAPEHLTRYGGIKGMNESTKRWILKKGPRTGRQHMLVPPNDSEGRMRTYLQSMPDFFMEGDDNAFSPIWMRDYSDPPDGVPENHSASEMLDEVLTKLDANRMVIGHTPQTQINAIQKGKAWRIDVGMSRGMNASTPEVLEVVKNDKEEEEVFVLTAEGRIPAEDRYINCDNQEHPEPEDG